MMLSEKQKKKAFTQSLHEFRKSMREYPDIPYFFQEHHDTIISLVDDLSLAHDLLGEKKLPYEKKIFDGYKAKIEKILNFTAKAIIELGLQPMEEEYQEAMDRILRNIEALRFDIKTGIIDLERINTSSREGEWGGAGVIITSDRNRKGHESDVVVHTRHAKAITWLMVRLRDIASGCINYANKYEFYGTIAKSAQKYIEENGDSKEILQNLMIHLLDEVISLLRSWR